LEKDKEGFSFEMMALKSPFLKLFTLALFLASSLPFSGHVAGYQHLNDVENLAERLFYIIPNLFSLVFGILIFYEPDFVPSRFVPILLEVYPLGQPDVFSYGRMAGERITGWQ